MKKRFLRTLICIFSLTLLLATAFLCVAATDTWDGTSDTNWYVLAPNAIDYNINTAEQLAGFASLVNSGSSFAYKQIYLKNDLDLSNIAWTPIGTEANPFIGKFYGNGHTITGLKTEITNGVMGYGLFGVIDHNSQKLGKIDGVNVEGDVRGYWSGGIVGASLGGSITGCTFTGTVYGERAAGGIVGEAIEVSSITYCASYAEVSASPDTEFIGKMVGLFSDSYICSCYNYRWGYNEYSSWDYVANSYYSNEEAAFRMNGEGKVDTNSEYSWIGDSDGVRITKNAPLGTTRMLVLNLGYDGTELQTYYGNASMRFPEPLAREGFSFYMWRRDDGEYYSAGDTIEIPGKYDLTAIWCEEETFDITVGVTENTVITLYLPDAPDIKYAEGEVINGVKSGTPIIMEYTVESGFELRSMTVNGEDVAGIITVATQDATIGADIITSVFSQETTVASVTLLSTNGVNYFDTLSEATQFVNSIDNSLTLITLYKNAEIEYTEIPQKPFILEGENGATNFTLRITPREEDSEQFFPTPHGVTFRNIRLDVGYLYGNKNADGECAVTLENVILGGDYDTCTISNIGELTLRGYINVKGPIGTTANTVGKLLFDNATVTVRGGIVCNQLELLGENELIATSLNSAGLIQIELEEQPSTGGTLKVTNSGNWTPASGDIIVTYIDYYSYNDHNAHERIILNFNNYTQGRYKITKRPVLLRYYTEYSLYNPSISLSASKASFNLGNYATLTATPSIKGDYIVSANYEWYCSQNEEGKGAVLIEGETSATFRATPEKGGIFYYYCILYDSNGREVRSNIVKITARATMLSTPANNVWGTGENVGIATWDTVENAQRYELKLYKDGRASWNVVGEIVKTTENSYDFNAQIAKYGAGTYYFWLIAIGNVTDFSDSSAKVSGEYIMPVIALEMEFTDGGATITANAQTVATLVFAAYDESGELLYVDVHEDTKISTGTHTYNASSDLNELGAHTIKLMLWESTNSARPLLIAATNQ